jgi:YVTN family beta-propeller protein
VAESVSLELKGARKEDITPVGLVMTRDGKTAFVTMGRSNHVAVVDVATRKMTNAILVGKRAWGLALSQDETRLFVANGLSDDMTVIDVKAGKALKSIPVGRVPYGIVLDE